MKTGFWTKIDLEIIYLTYFIPANSKKMGNRVNGLQKAFPERAVKRSIAQNFSTMSKKFRTTLKNSRTFRKQFEKYQNLGNEN